MDYEKKYKDALGRAKSIRFGNPQSGTANVVCEQIFPELRESEDERIRQYILSHLKYEYEKNNTKAVNGIPVVKIYAYLEKQKEQKPKIEICPHSIKSKSYSMQKPAVPVLPCSAAWFEDDDEKQKEQKSAEWNDADMREARNNLISVCRDWECGKKTTLLPVAAVRARYFLEHLVEPQKPAEWSEEDERILTGIIERGSSQIPPTEPALRGEQMEWLMNRLKSLRPSWKPSEEMTKALDKAIKNPTDIGIVTITLLNRLYEQLKQL